MTGETEAAAPVLTLGAAFGAAATIIATPAPAAAVMTARLTGIMCGPNTREVMFDITLKPMNVAANTTV